MFESVKPPAIQPPSEQDPVQTARSVRQIKSFLESPDQVADYIQELIRLGMINTGGKS